VRQGPAGGKTLAGAGGDGNAEDDDDEADSNGAFGGGMALGAIQVGVGRLSFYASVSGRGRDGRRDG
jgi:hypothetical protein